MIIIYFLFPDSKTEFANLDSSSFYFNHYDCSFTYSLETMAQKGMLFHVYTYIYACKQCKRKTNVIPCAKNRHFRFAECNLARRAPNVFLVIDCVTSLLR